MAATETAAIARARHCTATLWALYPDDEWVNYSGMTAHVAGVPAWRAGDTGEAPDLLRRAVRVLSAAVMVGAVPAALDLAEITGRVAYARLGVRSKAELAHRAGEFGLHAHTGARSATPDTTTPRS